MATPVGDGEANDVSNTGVGRGADVAAKAGAVAAVGAGAYGGAAAASAVGFYGLNWAGFTAIGPAAGSWAAVWMSTYGGAVPAGSLYAACQSAAMGGATILGGPVLAVGAVVGAGTGVLALTLISARWRKNKKKGSNDQGTAPSGYQPLEGDDQGTAQTLDDDDDDDDDEGTASESESETDRESKR